MTSFVALMYHNVCPPQTLSSPHSPFARLSPSITSYFVTSDQFAAHLKRVDRSRWLSPLALAAPAAAESPTASPTRVLLTFDDGWSGTFDEAGPILESAGATGLVFITTGLIGHPLFCTADTLRRIPRAQFEIGSHTISHPFLSELPERDIRRELLDSRRTLEDILGREVHTVSIPNGAVDDRVQNIALEAGYKFVFTSEVRVNRLGHSPQNVGRVAIRRDTSPETVQRWMSGQLGTAGWRRRLLGLPKRLLGPQRYRRLRGRILGQRRGQDEMRSLLTPRDEPLTAPVEVRS